MTVSYVLCSIQCKEASEGSSIICDSRWGNYDNCNDKVLEEIRMLHFLIRNNNIIGEDDCFDNCLLNTKLEQYGLRL